MLKHKLIALSAALPLALAVAASSAPGGSAPTSLEELSPSAEQAAAARLVYGILSDSRYVYRAKPLDDALSAEIHRRYLESLDSQKLFFTQADITRFEAYRNGHDDAIKNQRLDPAYEIFKTYLQRVDERVAHARRLLAKPFDFSSNETWAYDREDARWAANAAELDEAWRKYVKNDALRLRLAGRDQAEIRKTLDKRYAGLAERVHELRGDDVFESFMNAYATSIDPHTSYMAPRSAENFNMQMRLSLEGIGAVLQRQDEFVVIRTIVPGGPADNGGKLKVGDRVVAVGQGASGPMVDVVGWRIDDVVALIRGKKGTQVRLDVLPAEAGTDAKPQPISIIRDKVKLEQQAAQKRVIDIGDRRIGVVELPTFYLDFEARRRGDKDARSATADVARLLRELRAEKVDGVVIDLRDNGGGSLLEAVELTGLFIDQGPVVQVRETGGRVSVESDDMTGVAWDGPLAVLVNRSSASASEIFAAAIQDYGRGLIIGEPTFGKGTVQSLIDLDRFPRKDQAKFGQVKLTVAQFFRVDGGTTQHAGVLPDLAFPVSLDASEYGESTYDNALPATRIARAPHGNLGNLAALRPQLLQQHKARVATDREFRWWAEDVATFRAERDKKTLSLNETVRAAERDRLAAERKQREAERKAAGIDVASLARDDDGLAASERSVAQQAAEEEAAKNRPDPLLRESAAILADALDLLSADRQLTAQVLPVTRQPTVWAE
ncbi:carboxy terminal-processing peptidase [Arenimonas terrae]|jgi:carboxyl-terminal processing protease|uniref:Tail-specific protease n=1 Tax=Arenimonas terrae TaxID=2546226 RepID=A0A5C4RSE2_9GAMM|nr:carboxy terminal-processing peptidase [Arenimonas terrae]TNJ33958.1 tail-specific protease [Arenimonas terrae]